MLGQLAARTTLLALIAEGTLTHGADWPRFRGPNGSGVAADAARYPEKIGEPVWKTLLPRGHSSPIVWGDRIFVTAVDGGETRQLAPGRVVDNGKLLTICLNRADGRILWQREAPRPRVEQFQPANTPASPTPATDGKYVYVFFGDFGLLAYDFDGKEKWRLPLGPFRNANGHGSSPVVAGELVLVLCDQDTDSFLLAVDRRSGKVKWRAERPEITRGYATPVVFQPKGSEAEVIAPGAYQLVSYALKDGRKLWWIGGMSWQPKSTPTVDGDRLYAHWWEQGGEAEAPAATPEFGEMLAKLDADKDGKLSREELKPDPRLERSMGDLDLDSNGFVEDRDWYYYRARRASRNALLAVRGGGRGDVERSHVDWRMQKFLPNAPSPLLYQGILYLIKDGGILTAVKAADGTLLKQGRLPNALDTYYASPVAAGGYVYLVGQSGKFTIVRAGADWEAVASHDFAEESHATPAPVDGRLYVRTKSALYCF